MARKKPVSMHSFFESRMGDLVAAVFLLMFCFGLLTFVAVVGMSFFVVGVDGKIALGLLTFATSGAMGFAATWRFMVLSKTKDETTAPAADELGDGGPRSAEREFHDRFGYWPMSTHEDRSSRWRR